MEREHISMSFDMELDALRTKILAMGGKVEMMISGSIKALLDRDSPLADQIIAHTKLLGPKLSDEISFKAPTEPGEYHFLCSFPAHFLTGMTGVMVVK